MSPTCLHKLNYHYLHHSLHIVKVSTQCADRASISWLEHGSYQFWTGINFWAYQTGPGMGFLFSFFLSYLAGTGVEYFSKTFITVWVQGWLLAGIWQILAWYQYWYKEGIHLVFLHVPYPTGPSISLVSLRLYPTSMFFSTSTHTSTIYSNNSLEVTNNLHCILYSQVFL
jgi:hypothetical protein